MCGVDLVVRGCVEGYYLCFKRFERCRKEVELDRERSFGIGVGL